MTVVFLSFREADIFGSAPQPGRSTWVDLGDSRRLASLEVNYVEVSSLTYFVFLGPV